MARTMLDESNVKKILLGRSRQHFMLYLKKSFNKKNLEQCSTWTIEKFNPKYLILSHYWQLLLDFKQIDC